MSRWRIAPARWHCTHVGDSCENNASYAYDDCVGACDKHAKAMGVDIAPPIVRTVPPHGFALAAGWIALERPGEFRDDVDWKCDDWGCHELAIYGETGGPCRVACAEHAVEFGAIFPVPVPALPIEVRVIPGDGGSWTVEGWRGGVRRYIRAYNRTADEAWSYGSDWMREELMMNAKETK